MNSLKQPHIGIWGYGITGASVARFCTRHNHTFEIMEQCPQRQKLAAQEFPHAHAICSEDERDLFLQRNDQIVVSPGIDIRSVYAQYQHKWLCELDLFYQHAHLPIVAITGTLGKTTITSLLSDLFCAQGKKVLTGGNIGTAMLDLLPHQDTAEMFLLEVSDVQLRYTKQFCPDVAVLTNFHQNHLDWHDSFEAYFYAKCRLFAQQKEHQIALVPTHLKNDIKVFSNSHAIFYSFNDALHSSTMDTFTIANNHLQFHNKPLIYLDELPPITFEQNWLIITAIAYLLNLDMKTFVQAATHLKAPEHRREYVATINGIMFYNDAKSTTMDATLAAVNTFSPPVHLLLGGKSKGVDRAPFIKQLYGRVMHVACFGSEAEHLHMMCQQVKIAATVHKTLEEAFDICTQHAKAGQVILCSPGGSSFDLFANYVQRGLRFKQLVNAYQQHGQCALPGEQNDTQTSPCDQ